MAIDSTGLPLSAPQASGTRTLNTTGGNGKNVQRMDSVTTAAPTDTVTLTEQANQLKGIETSIANQSIVDEPRVERLKSAIDAGLYKINPARVAEKFIQFESNFTGNLGSY